MPLPFFYIEEISLKDNLIFLNEETSKHVVQVLRMKIGDQVQLTDGKGNLFLTEIINNDKKKCVVQLKTTSHKPQAIKKIGIAISLLKNTNRFEWFLEKATEIGVTEITPLLCTRTEKQNFRYERMKNILISAMLQSQQCWLPILHEPILFESFVNKKNEGHKFIAHCIDESTKKNLASQQVNKSTNQFILIGPEGDFTTEEIQLAIENNFIPVSLGNTRLRTETAGIVAITIFNQ